MSEKYNGWTNYETWNVKMWMDKDGGDYATEEARKALAEAEDEDEATNILATRLEDMHYSHLEELNIELPGTFGDLLAHALGCVNWYAIAYACIRDLDE